MWLVEFIDGHLHGVILPVEPKLVITGSNKDIDAETLYVPEILPVSTRWEFCNDKNIICIRGTRKNDRLKKLKSGRIYRLRGIAFFVYQEGKRKPQWLSYLARKYQALIMLTLLLNAGLGLGMWMVYQANQYTQIAEHLTQLNGSYVKNGKLKVPNSASFLLLPEALQANAEIVEANNLQILSQPVVELVSSDSKQPVSYKVINKVDRDQIQVETFETDNRVMAVLGEYGLSFNKINDTWFVNDNAKAAIVLRANGLQDIIPSVSVRNDSTQVIDNANFPYSIFYSSTSRGYIYDDKYRYWVGSNVPLLGVIQSISRNKVIFKDRNQTRVYFIQS